MASPPEQSDEPRSTSEGVHIGAKLREWRHDSRTTLTEVSEAVGLSVGYISQVERGRANPSLEALKRLADVLGHTVGELFSNEAPPANPLRYSVSKRGERKRIMYPGSGIMNELLSPDLQHQMEVVWVEAPVGATSGGHPHSHVGEECGIVLAGQMIFWIGDDEVKLEAGDAIYLDSTVPHRWHVGEGEDLKAVWLITPPTF
ncbi:helix-turn-helix domain-containing protein [Amycolatopsis sp. NPDC051903]|uniref:helix-turn-helix domain-containing protein n=1 Tax=Amycolatopsis sp. NPDC051903 TaxID=3363936 RepID=UPI00378969BB